MHFRTLRISQKWSSPDCESITRHQTACACAADQHAGPVAGRYKANDQPELAAKAYENVLSALDKDAVGDASACDGR